MDDQPVILSLRIQKIIQKNPFRRGLSLTKCSLNLNISRLSKKCTDFIKTSGQSICINGFQQVIKGMDTVTLQ